MAIGGNPPELPVRIPPLLVYIRKVSPPQDRIQRDKAVFMSGIMQYQADGPFQEYGGEK